MPRIPSPRPAAAARAVAPSPPPRPATRTAAATMVSTGIMYMASEARVSASWGMPMTIRSPTLPPKSLRIWNRTRLRPRKVDTTETPQPLDEAHEPHADLLSASSQAVSPVTAAMRAMPSIMPGRITSGGARGECAVMIPSVRVGVL